LSHFIRIFAIVVLVTQHLEDVVMQGFFEGMLIFNLGKYAAKIGFQRENQLSRHHGAADPASKNYIVTAPQTVKISVWMDRLGRGAGENRLLSCPKVGAPAFNSGTTRQVVLQVGLPQGRVQPSLVALSGWKMRERRLVWDSLFESFWMPVSSHLQNVFRSVCIKLDKEIEQ
jgi:hypothetical protein